MSAPANGGGLDAMTWRAWQFVAPLNAAPDGVASHPYLAGKGSVVKASGTNGLERGIAGHRFRRLTLR